MNGLENCSNKNSHSENEKNKLVSQNSGWLFFYFFKAVINAKKIIFTFCLKGMPSKSISKFSRKNSINHHKHLKQNESLTSKLEYLEKQNKSLQEELDKERFSKQIILNRVIFRNVLLRGNFSCLDYFISAFLFRRILVF